MEKSLKAVLVHHGIAVPLVHDLGVLVASLPEASRPRRGFELIDFNDFAALLRYREGKAILEASDLETAIVVAEELLHWAEKIVGAPKPKQGAGT